MFYSNLNKSYVAIPELFLEMEESTALQLLLFLFCLYQFRNVKMFCKSANFCYCANYLISSFETYI